MSGTLRKALLLHSASLHTTEMGVERIKRNLSIDTDGIVKWCRKKIRDPNADITRRRKNYCMIVDNCIITVNAHSYTIITAHRL